MRIRNWYSERARLLQEIALQQPITTDHISIRFKKLEGEQSVMVIHVDYEEVKKRKSKTLHIPMTDEDLALSYLHEWLLYINLTWCCGSASVTVDNGEDKYTLSFEPVIHNDRRKFKIWRMTSLKPHISMCTVQRRNALSCRLILIHSYSLAI